jgi:glyoxylase-like metal-dependent hydrolase (beta-lactamase superfamily II)
MSDTYEVYAIRYAHHPDRVAVENFIGADPHDLSPDPLDYFVWAAVGDGGTFVVDTGFDQAAADRRKRQLLRSPGEGLRAIGIAPETVKDVIITHMHYDHAGNEDLFPNARFHVQDKEMQFCTGRAMCHHAFRVSYYAGDVEAMVRRLFAGRVQFHDGAAELAPGLSVHHIGGHTAGIQVVRVKTRRGSVVLASDTSHLYENMEEGRPFPIVLNVADMLEGHRTVRALASSPAHVIPGHDPDVMRRYPAPRPELKNILVRLDVEPSS